MKARKSFSRFESEELRERSKEKAKDVRRRSERSKWEVGFKAGGFGRKEDRSGR